MEVFKNLLEWGFEFVLSKRGGISSFKLNFLLLLAEVYFILKKQGCKVDMFVAHGFSYMKIVFTLPKKIIALHI